MSTNHPFSSLSPPHPLYKVPLHCLLSILQYPQKANPLFAPQLCNQTSWVSSYSVFSFPFAILGSGYTTMAAASATLSPATFTASSIASPRRGKSTNVQYITGLNAFGGLKAHNSVASLGLPLCTEKCFAKVVSSLRTPSQSRGRGALSSTCSAVGEIFRIAAIMNGLVLVGVAVGFVLLRIEASIEEAE